MREGASVGSTITELIDIVNDRLKSSLKENPTLNYAINHIDTIIYNFYQTLSNERIQAQMEFSLFLSSILGSTDVDEAIDYIFDSDHETLAVLLMTYVRKCTINKLELEDSLSDVIKGLHITKRRLPVTIFFSKRIYFLNNITAFFFKLLPDFTTKLWNVIMGTRLTCDQLELLISWIKAMKMLEGKVSVETSSRVVDLGAYALPLIAFKIKIDKELKSSKMFKNRAGVSGKNGHINHDPSRNMQSQEINLNPTKMQETIVKTTVNNNDYITNTTTRVLEHPSMQGHVGNEALLAKNAVGLEALGLNAANLVNIDAANLDAILSQLGITADGMQAEELKEAMQKLDPKELAKLQVPGRNAEEKLQNMLIRMQAGTLTIAELAVITNQLITIATSTESLRNNVIKTLEVVQGKLQGIVTKDMTNAMLNQAQKAGSQDKLNQLNKNQGSQDKQNEANKNQGSQDKQNEANKNQGSQDKQNEANKNQGSQDKQNEANKNQEGQGKQNETDKSNSQDNKNQDNKQNTDNSEQKPANSQEHKDNDNQQYNEGNRDNQNQDNQKYNEGNQENRNDNQPDIDNSQNDKPNNNEGYNNNNQSYNNEGNQKDQETNTDFNNNNNNNETTTSQPVEQDKSYNDLSVESSVGDKEQSVESSMPNQSETQSQDGVSTPSEKDGAIQEGSEIDSQTGTPEQTTPETPPKATSSEKDTASKETPQQPSSTDSQTSETQKEPTKPEISSNNKTQSEKDPSLGTKSMDSYAPQIAGKQEQGGTGDNSTKKAKVEQDKDQR